MSSPKPSEVYETIARLSIDTSNEPQLKEENREGPPTPPQAEPSPKRRPSRKGSNSGSETEKEKSHSMSSRSSKHQSPSSSSSKKHHSSSSKHKTKSDDWTEVTEPEERRRIQNRIAQRKFREKAREQKESQERESQNQEYAGSSYSVPMAADFPAEEEELSGVPWGGMNIQHMISRGHNHESRKSSRKDSDIVYDETQQYDPQLMSPYGVGYTDTVTGGSDGRNSSGDGDETYFDDSSPSYFAFDYDSHFSGDNSSSRTQ